MTLNHSHPNYVFGYSGLAEMTKATPATLAMRRARGKLPLEPQFYVGRTAVYLKSDVEAYLKTLNADD